MIIVAILVLLAIIGMVGILVGSIIQFTLKVDLLKLIPKPLVTIAVKYSLFVGLLVSVMAMAGSLYYSAVLKFAPCELCWYQRIFMYPQVIVFLVAIISRDRFVFKYIFPLSLISIIFVTYQLYITYFPPPFQPCDASGVSCTVEYVSYFGFITIPVMSLVSSILTAYLAWISKYRIL